MIFLIARCRRALSRHRGVRLLWAVALFGLVLSAIPQWELHRHALADHDHGHHHAPIPADVDDALPVSVASDAAGTHGHATPSIPVVLIEAELQAFDGLARRVPDFPATELLAPACCWPPPYRPPIA